MLSTGPRKIHCHNCLQLIEMVEGCRSSVLCPDCHIISYCSLDCLAEDRADHKLECSFMEELEELPDIDLDLPDLEDMEHLLAQLIH